MIFGYVEVDVGMLMWVGVHMYVCVCVCVYVCVCVCMHRCVVVGLFGEVHGSVSRCGSGGGVSVDVI